MGGQILRHCLLYWEANLESSYGAHGVKLMISADSPWTGANASIGVQAMARINKDKGSAVMTLIDASVNSPAACQLLLVHIEGGLNTTNTEYTSRQHAFKTAWDDELTLLGSVPQKTEKNLALADGSGNGTSTNVSPGEMIMTIQFGVSSGLLGNLCGMYSKINAIKTGEQIVDRGGAGICGLIASSKLPRVKLVNTTLDFDSAPGSPFRLDTYLKKIKVGEVVSNEGGFKAKIESVTAGEPFSFIPTFSALVLGSQNMTSNIFNMATNQGAAGYTLSNSPFDYVYFDNVDSGHNEFTSGQQPGSLPFVLYHLQYQKVQETKCNIIEGFIPLNHNIEIKYDQFATLCAPISGIYNVQIPGENECQLTVTFENGEFVFNAPSLQEVCESDVDVCFDVKDCNQSYCITVHVVVIPIPDNHRPGTSNQNVTAHTSLNDIHLNSAISIYPNPTNGKVTIKAQNDINEYRLKILDITGRNLYEQNLTSEIIDLQNFAPGIYNLVLTNKKGWINYFEKNNSF
ncbi:MAG: T9SS type A sorting domain-containing protein [Saprospiraceae bacterium]|nr:T9SS type A sorting domain-containing protein [Saprospiraceae bacterium]